MNITKNHKLYFRTSDGTIKRLDKVARNIYIDVLNAFFSGKHKAKYERKNKRVKDWSKYKPVTFILSKERTIEFLLLSKQIDRKRGYEPIVISYNGSWQPLVEITLDGYQLSILGIFIKWVKGIFNKKLWNQTNSEREL